MTNVSYAVILTRGVERAAVALESIAAQTPASELLLVLNGADEPMRRLAARWVERGARVVHDGADLGVMLAYNVALEASRHDVFCTVHEDSDLAPGCIERLVRTLAEQPSAAAVGPSVDTPAATGADASITWSDGATSGVPGQLDADVHAVDYAGTHCLVLRRDVVAGLGGFDVRFFPAIYGDVDLGARLWQEGWAVLCDRRARNVHRTGAMVDETRGPRRSARFRQFLLERNRGRFVEKHAAWLSSQSVRENPIDARYPSTAEVHEALRRADARWRGIAGRAAPPVGPSRVELPGDLDAFAAARRSAFEDEFLQHLLDREAQLAGEVAELHGAYAELHGRYVALNDEAAGVHRAYAELHAELERVMQA